MIHVCRLFTKFLNEFLVLAFQVTVESLYLEPLYLEISLSRTKYLVPRMRFQANFLSLSRTLSISNKYFGPVKVRDREILLYSKFQIFISFISQHGGCGNKLPQRGSRSDYYYLPRHCKGVLDEEQMKIAKEECGDVRMVCGADVEEGVETHNKRALEVAMGKVFVTKNFTLWLDQC